MSCGAHEAKSQDSTCDEMGEWVPIALNGMSASCGFSVKRGAPGHLANRGNHIQDQPPNHPVTGYFLETVGQFASAVLRLPLVSLLNLSRIPLLY